MPARLRVTLAEKVVHGVGPPPQTGPAIHAAVLRAVDALDPETAVWLHGQRPHKPLSITQLHAAGVDGLWRFEVGVLDDPLVPAILRSLQAIGELRIGHSSFLLEQIDGRTVAYQALLAGSVPRTSWRLRFRSPTTFRTALGRGVRRSVPLPDPTLMLGSLIARWEALSGGVELPPGTARAALEHVAIRTARIHTDSHLTKAPDIREVGFLGHVELIVVGADRVREEALTGLSALVTFATFAGVGDQTAKGMGWVELQPEQ